MRRKLKRIKEKEVKVEILLLHLKVRGVEVRRDEELKEEEGEVHVPLHHLLKIVIKEEIVHYQIVQDENVEDQDHIQLQVVVQMMMREERKDKGSVGKEIEK